MKSELIVNLVKSHWSDNSDDFEKSLECLIQDEERKGNVAIATSLRRAGALRTHFSEEGKTLQKTIQPPGSFSGQSIGLVPKDKDSALDLIDMQTSSVKLIDVALSEKTKNIIMQIVNEQQHWDEFINLGMSPTNRVLFCGPPGCGKTMTAYALANEMSLPVAYVRLDGLVSSYLGQTGANIRKIFEFARNRRLMLFLDEFDAIAKKRDDSHELGELKRVVTTLLQNLDNMSPNIFLVAATNHQHLLDPAIWRRFDLSIIIELPEVAQREKIITQSCHEYFKKHTVDVLFIARLTLGMNGAQIHSFMQILAKYCLLNMPDITDIPRDTIVQVWLKYVTHYAGEDSVAYIKALKQLRENGFSLRQLEKLTGISRSTIDYRTKKENTDE